MLKNQERDFSLSFPRRRESGFCVIPTEVGIQDYRKRWFPAFAGMTEKGRFRGRDETFSTACQPCHVV
jgi:hypothetical protein